MPTGCWQCWLAGSSSVSHGEWHCCEPSGSFQVSGYYHNALVQPSYLWHLLDLGSYLRSEFTVGLCEF